MPLRRADIPRRRASKATEGTRRSFTKLPKLAARGLLSKLRGAELRVLVAICDHLPHPFPSVARIAAQTGLSERAVHGAKARLENLGVIRWSKPTASRRSCTYTVNFDLPAPPAVDEPQFTPRVNEPPRDTSTGEHSTTDLRFIESKTKLNKRNNEKTQQDCVHRLGNAENGHDQLGIDPPAATRSQAVAVRNALGDCGVKTPTINRLIARQPYLLPDTVYTLWALARRRAPRNCQGYLVTLIRDEGERVTRKFLATQAATSATASPADDGEQTRGATSASGAPVARATLSPATDAYRGFCKNVAERDRRRIALSLCTADDPTERDRLEAELTNLLAVETSVSSQ